MMARWLGVSAQPSLLAFLREQPDAFYFCCLSAPAACSKQLCWKAHLSGGLLWKASSEILSIVGAKPPRGGTPSSRSKEQFLLLYLEPLVVIPSEANVVFFPPGSLLRAAWGVGGWGGCRSQSCGPRREAPSGASALNAVCSQQLIIHYSPTAKHRGGAAQRAIG